MVKKAIISLVLLLGTCSPSLRTADAFPVVFFLPPKNSVAIFGGREATTGNASAVRRLCSPSSDSPFPDIDHNAPCLPPKILRSRCFQFLLGIIVAPREIKDKGYKKFF